ncbi:MAG: zinc-ribbon domain-containing protein [Treponema sp.]|nr:zinc-ribbon domain-containing protein [Treponema sp.]
MFCVKCGKELADGEKFCPACGTRQGGDGISLSALKAQTEQIAGQTKKLVNQIPKGRKLNLLELLAASFESWLNILAWLTIIGCVIAVAVSSFVAAKFMYGGFVAFLSGLFGVAIGAFVGWCIDVGVFGFIGQIISIKKSLLHVDEMLESKMVTSGEEVAGE